MKKDLAVTAYVVVQPEAGGSPQHALAENIHQWMPSSHRMAEVAAAFRDAGFHVGDAIANSIPITATVGHFEKYFQHPLEEGAMGHPRGDLPLHRMTDELKSKVHGIGFPAVPDFGTGAG